MKTDDLIAALAAEPAPPPGPPLEARALLWGAGGAVVTLLAFLVVLGPRPELGAALADPLVLAKTLLPLGLAAIALPLTFRAARPGLSAGRLGRVALLPPALAAALFVYAFAATGAGERLALFIGHSIPVCLPSITLLSLPISGALIAALRRGAPTRPARAGALAGLAAAGIAAGIYSTFCTEDSPLFYAVWYTAGMGLATGAGALIGRRALAW